MQYGHVDTFPLWPYGDVMSFDFIAPIVHEFEIHLCGDPGFTSGPWGRKVKDLGGRYTECRGYHDGRTVDVPNTAPGRKLAAELIVRFSGYVPLAPKGKTTVILRRIEGECAYRGEGSANLEVNYVNSCREQREEDGAADVLKQLGALLTKYEERCRVRWERVGRPAAIRKAEDDARWAAQMKAAAPEAAAAAVRRALELGCSVEEVRAAVEPALAEAKKLELRKLIGEAS